MPVVHAYSVADLYQSDCFNEYVNDAKNKLNAISYNKIHISDKRTYNLYQAAINGKGHYTFGELFHKVQEKHDGIQEEEVLQWLRYGFISGDLCPVFPMISGYYDWEKSVLYLVEIISKNGKTALNSD